MSAIPALISSLTTKLPQRIYLRNFLNHSPIPPLTIPNKPNSGRKVAVAGSLLLPCASLDCWFGLIFGVVELFAVASDPVEFPWVAFAGGGVPVCWLVALLCDCELLCVAVDEVCAVSFCCWLGAVALGEVELCVAPVGMVAAGPNGGMFLAVVTPVLLLSICSTS